MHNQWTSNIRHSCWGVKQPMQLDHQISKRWQNHKNNAQMCVWRPTSFSQNRKLSKIRKRKCQTTNMNAEATSAQRIHNVCDHSLNVWMVDEEQWVIDRYEGDNAA